MNVDIPNKNNDSIKKTIKLVVSDRGVNLEKSKKIISKDVENEITNSIIEQLKKNQCTITNFDEISKRVHQFFNDNATI